MFERERCRQSTPEIREANVRTEELDNAGKTLVFCIPFRVEYNSNCFAAVETRLGRRQIWRKRETCASGVAKLHDDPHRDVTAPEPRHDSDTS